MQIFGFLCVVVVGCMSMPVEEQSEKRTPSVGMLLQAVAETTNTAHKRDELSRRNTESETDAAVELAFGLIDANDDSHITVEEFATYYARFMPALTYDQWKWAITLTLTRVDTNRNGQLEIDEFLALAMIGGFQG